MATKRKSKKNILKPEYSIKVVPKKTATQQVKKVSKPKKVVKKPNIWQKLPSQKKRAYIFAVLVLAIVFVTAVSVVVSVRRANEALISASQAADNLNIVDAEANAEARLIGSNEQLAKEIDNYSSAPADLQEYTLKDYRTLKQKCIVNGKVYGSLSYAIAGVADAQYAQIKRNCNGQQTQILKKFAEKWTVVHEGNNPPLCNLVNDLAIPQRVSLNCVIGGTTYLNPNP